MVKDKNKKRCLTLYADNSDISLSYMIDSVPNNLGSGYYIDEVALFSSLNEEYIRKNIKRVYLELFENEIASIHHSFCRELAIAWDVEVFFKYSGFEIRVSKDTPDDWWDISFEDAIQLYKDNPTEIKYVGPYYVNLSGELLKKSIWICSMRISEIDNAITKSIQFDYPEYTTWRDEFKGYLEYRGWSTERMMEEFIMRRRIKRYSDLLQLCGDTFTKEDVDRYYEEYLAEVKNKQKDTLLEEKNIKRRKRSNTTEPKK